MFFKKEKDSCTDRVVKVDVSYVMTPEDDYWATGNEVKHFADKDALMSFAKDYVGYSDYNGNRGCFVTNEYPMKLYRFQEIKKTYYKNGDVKEEHDCIDKYQFKKSDIEKTDFVPFDEKTYGSNCRRMLNDWEMKYFVVSGEGTLYIQKDDYTLFESLVNNSIEAFVKKDTDWPYYFKIKDLMMPSRTKDFTTYLWDTYHFGDPIKNGTFVAYNGEDKSDKHISDTLPDWFRL